MDPDELASIAQQLVARVRDDDPEANARWLNAMTTPQDRYALLFVLAAAVPDDVRWSILTDWVGRERDTADREFRLRPHGTLAAVRRHQRAGERLCGQCRASERVRAAERRARANSAGVSQAGSSANPSHPRTTVAS